MLESSLVVPFVILTSLTIYHADVRAFSTSPSPASSSLRSRIVIAGGGPCGLALAHFLVRRGFNITVIESRGDPRGEPLGPRQYSLGLNIRARTTLSGPNNGSVWDAIKDQGVESDRFFVHLGTRIKLNIRQKRSGAPPSLLISRGLLCSALLDTLQKFVADGRLKLMFAKRIDKVDLANRRVILRGSDGEEHSTVPYDFLAGGNRAVAREPANSSIRVDVVSHRVRWSPKRCACVAGGGLATTYEGRCRDTGYGVLGVICCT
mmetsp:Transcript_26717/g.66467  ORF Transcript_26717/g.66467 Transcript_26717/m.66467 type:complete len:263 (-) Transcript_26717:352-1140(-)